VKGVLGLAVIASCSIAYAVWQSRRGMQDDAAATGRLRPERLPIRDGFAASPSTAAKDAINPSSRTRRAPGTRFPVSAVASAEANDGSASRMSEAVSVTRARPAPPEWRSRDEERLRDSLAGGFVNLDLDNHQQTLAGLRLRIQAAQVGATQSEADLENSPEASDPDVEHPGARRLRSRLAAAAADEHRWAKPDSPADGWLSLIADRKDLQGLPFRKGAACRLNFQAAAVLSAISQGQRGAAAPRRSLEQLSQPFNFASFGGRADLSGTAFVTGAISFIRQSDASLGRYVELSPDSIVPALVQMIQVNGTEERKVLVAALRSIEQPNATAGLVQRALFDLSREVRTAAVAALASRPRADYRQQFLEGLKHPWPAVADHAAVALVTLDDQGAVPQLVELLDEPDPRLPYRNRAGKWEVRELARVNHLRNCLLCHAPSLSLEDPARGVVPTPGEPLPELYYLGQRGTFVRADITYLVQDFSLMESVKDPGPWPKLQRFDYVLRTRELSREEAYLKDDEPAPVSASDALESHRQAVLYALRALTGREGPPSSYYWRRYLALRE
jgi:hypothetical protein